MRPRFNKANLNFFSAKNMKMPNFEDKRHLRKKRIMLKLSDIIAKEKKIKYLKT